MLEELGVEILLSNTYHLFLRPGVETVRKMGGLHQFGLTNRTAAFTRDVSSNILHAFADGPAAAKYPAHDNLAQMQEWAGDPIAAGHNLWPPVVL